MRIFYIGLDARLEKRKYFREYLRENIDGEWMIALSNWANVENSFRKIKICRMKSTALLMFLLAAGRGQGWGRVHSRRWPWRERQVLKSINQSQNIGLGCGR